MKGQAKSYDFIIIGGSIVGLAAAIGLAQQGYAIAIVDPLLAQKSKAPLTTAQRARVFAVNHATIKFLKTLGVWQRLSDEAHFPYETMTLVDGPSNATVSITAEAVDSATLGEMVSQQALQAALLSELEHSSTQRDICLIQGAMDAVDMSGANQVSVSVSTPESEVPFRELQGCYLIGADGASSLTRQAANIPVITKPCHQTAFTGAIQLKQPWRLGATQWFTEKGPMAFLPVSERVVSVVYSIDEASAEPFRALSLEAQQHRILQIVRQTEEVAIESMDALTAFPLTNQWAEVMVQGRVILVGDAAHQMHPMAGQGANIGLADVFALCEHFALRRAKQKPFNKPMALLSFAAKRQKAVKPFIYALMGLQSAFAIQAPWVSLLKGQLMRQLNRQTVLKQWMVKYANQSE